jgi:hypothetical protein
MYAQTIRDLVRTLYLAFRAFGAVAAGAVAAALPLALDGAFGLGAATSSAGAVSALGLTTGAFAVSTAMLLRRASMMLTTLLGPSAARPPSRAFPPAWRA